MHKEYCVAHPSNKHGVEFVEEVETQREIPNKWNKPIITYRLLKDSEDINGYTDEMTAINLAFTTWELEIPLKCIRVPKEQESDITIEFRHNDPFWKDRPSVLAYAGFPGMSFQGIFVYNDNYLWGLKDGKRTITNPDGSKSVVKVYNMLHTAIHEIGHLLGLIHAEGCAECVMNPYYNNIVDLDDHDISRITDKYGIREWKREAWYLRLKRWLSKRVRR